MMWAGRPFAAYLLYVPPAVAGVLLPHALFGDVRPRQLLWGFALFSGALAELLSWGGLGLAYSLAAWAMCALGLAAFSAAVRPTAKTKESVMGQAVCAGNCASLEDECLLLGRRNSFQHFNGPQPPSFRL